MMYFFHFLEVIGATCAVVGVVALLTAYFYP